MDGTRHGPAKLRVTMAEAAEILGVSVEAAEMIATLLEQVQAERQAHAETRRLLAAALERIPPQLEPPSERSEAPVSSQEEADPTRAPSDPDEDLQRPASQRSWWSRIFAAAQ
jgi:hypothetical protein